MNNAAMTAIRAIATKSVTYAYTLAFTREFTSGTLAGLTHDDIIGFCRAADADEWVTSVNAANARGKVDYRVIKWSVASAY